MIPLFTTEQIRMADKYAIEKLGLPGIVLMENASVSLFELILQHFSEIEIEDEIGIVAGKGNNGGDGFGLARHFVNSGFKVKVISLARKKELRGDALTNHDVFVNLAKKNSLGSIKYFSKLSDLNTLNSCAVIIDAILGTGTKGNIREPYASIISKLNSFEAIKVAVDIPSGLDADKGTGEIVFDADLTVTLAELKRGLYFEAGYSHSGDVLKGYIGIGSEFFDKMPTREYLIEPEDVFYRLPEKSLDTHKYLAGKVLVIGGAKQYPGAAVFTVNATQKVGSGASILAYPESLGQTVVAGLESATLQLYNDDSVGFLSDKNVSEISDRLNWSDVIAIGPGLGREEPTKRAVREILRKHKSKSFVLDADAIHAISAGEYKKFNLKNKVLTPHHKEFSDLLGITTNELEKDVLAIGKKFVKETGAYLVLKGAPTIVFSPQGDTFINTTGNPGMAKFGSGDVLTGVIAGFMSQNLHTLDACIAGVYIHSLAADLLIEEKTIYGFTPTDILNNLPEAIKYLADSII